MGKFAWEVLADKYKKQAKKHLTEDTINDLSNVDSEFYDDACDSLTQITFKTETGQQWNLQYAEGGIWAIPKCFRGKKASEFFGD